jgi:hypothetical protein
MSQKGVEGVALEGQRGFENQKREKREAKELVKGRKRF